MDMNNRIRKLSVQTEGVRKIEMWKVRKATGEVIKSARELRRLTITETAEFLRMTPSNYQRIENGQNITIQNLYRIAVLFKIQARALLPFIRFK